MFIILSSQLPKLFRNGASDKIEEGKEQSGSGHLQDKKQYLLIIWKLWEITIDLFTWVGVGAGGISNVALRQYI